MEVEVSGEVGLAIISKVDISKDGFRVSPRVLGEQA